MSPLSTEPDAPPSPETRRSCWWTYRESTAFRRVRKTSRSPATFCWAKCPDVDKPDAILLILDCTNLGRHLVLAAPILSLGLPTLVVLNMVDDLRKRGGEVDPLALAAQLGAPVALISAYTGEGVERVGEFLEKTVQGTAKRRPPVVELPVLNDIPKCRAWAAKVGRKADYQAPAPPLWTRRLDSVFLHPILGPVIFALVVIGVFQTIFVGRPPPDGWRPDPDYDLGQLARLGASALRVPFAAD